MLPCLARMRLLVRDEREDFCRYICFRCPFQAIRGFPVGQDIGNRDSCVYQRLQIASWAVANVSICPSRLSLEEPHLIRISGRPHASRCMRCRCYVMCS